MTSYVRHFDRRFELYDADIREPDRPDSSSPPGLYRPSTTVVSFWAGDLYKRHAEEFVEAMRKTNVSYLVFRVDRGELSWEECCNLKPVAIMHAMSLIPKRPVLWLDIDARVVPGRSFTTYYPQAAVACCRPTPGVTWPLVNSRLLSGTLWFNSTLAATMLLERWRDRCAVQRRALDQDSLADVLEAKASRDLIIADMPAEDVCIPDLMPDIAPRANIVHLQASRVTRTAYQ